MGTMWKYTSVIYLRIKVTVSLSATNFLLISNTCTYRYLELFILVWFNFNFVTVQPQHNENTEIGKMLIQSGTCNIKTD